VILTLEGRVHAVLPELRLDRAAHVRGAEWSPDGLRLLLDVADATFVDGGVSEELVAADPAGLAAPVVLTPWKLGFYADTSWQGVPS